MCVRKRQDRTAECLGKSDRLCNSFRFKFEALSLPRVLPLSISPLFSSLHHGGELGSLLSESSLAADDVAVFVKSDEARDEEQSQEAGNT
jgi:hypothetical protein